MRRGMGPSWVCRPWRSATPRPGASVGRVRHEGSASDRGVTMLERMFERLRGYRALGYARGEAPLGFAEAPAELLLEYDEEALRALDRVRDPVTTRGAPP